MRTEELVAKATRVARAVKRACQQDGMAREQLTQEQGVVLVSQVKRLVGGRHGRERGLAKLATMADRERGVDDWSDSTGQTRPQARYLGR